MLNGEIIKVIIFFYFESKFLGYMVDPAHRPGIAAQYPPYTQEKPSYSAMLFKSGNCIAAASRIVFTSCRRIGSYKLLIQPYKTDKNIFHLSFLLFISFLTPLLTSGTPYFLMYSQYSSDFISQRRLLATITTSIPTGRSISDW